MIKELVSVCEGSGVILLTREQVNNPVLPEAPIGLYNLDLLVVRNMSKSQVFYDCAPTAEVSHTTLPPSITRTLCIDGSNE